jgi:multiple sugar transport system permease protein
LPPRRGISIWRHRPTTVPRQQKSIVEYIYESDFTRFRTGYTSAISYALFALIAAIALAHFRITAARR